jgi:hypothetical protein
MQLNVEGKKVATPKKPGSQKSSPQRRQNKKREAHIYSLADLNPNRSYIKSTSRHQFSGERLSCRCSGMVLSLVADSSDCQWDFHSMNFHLSVRNARFGQWRLLLNQKRPPKMRKSRHSVT